MSNVIQETPEQNSGWWLFRARPLSRLFESENLAGGEARPDMEDFTTKVGTEWKEAKSRDNLIDEYNRCRDGDEPKAGLSA